MTPNIVMIATQPPKATVVIVDNEGDKRDKLLVVPCEL